MKDLIKYNYEQAKLVIDQYHRGFSHGLWTGIAFHVVLVLFVIIWVAIRV